MRLGVNIDHVATLRQARRALEPEPALAALIAEENGADSIVVHLREDRRHINDNDLYLLRGIVRVKLNMEMSISGGIVDIACAVKPDQSTLVPEKREELTTEGGLDVTKKFNKVKETVSKLECQGIDVSIFVDPVPAQIRSAYKAGARMIELHTGRYANAKDKKAESKHLNELISAAKFAKSLGMGVVAGHGLDYNNAVKVAAIDEIEELNIGHSIVARGLFIGLGRAVKEMKELIN
ncbi:MAG: Pyridoxine 5'-phosphate synthase [Candidatus Omnitrophica bacterium ADurb.Bin205]|nr:MAG: Pyridoxine 5'-phosphate synthase [Candidatus Omnitrophica bacterium ADurb.Bin205]